MLPTGKSNKNVEMEQNRIEKIERGKQEKAKQMDNVKRKRNDEDLRTSTQDLVNAHDVDIDLCLMTVRRRKWRVDQLGISKTGGHSLVTN